MDTPQAGLPEALLSPDKPTRILAAISSSIEVQSRLQRALKEQSKYPMPFDWVVISEEPLQDQFETILFDARQDGFYSISKSRNKAVDTALERGYDYLIISDTDGVLVKPPARLPKTGFSSARCHMLEENEEPLFKEEKSIPVSFYLLSRELFSKYRWDEQFYGYGYEDVDYFSTLFYNGIHPDDTGLRAMHLWHPIKPTSEKPRFFQNRELSKRKLDALIQSTGIPFPGYNNFF